MCDLEDLMQSRYDGGRSCSGLAGVLPDGVAKQNKGYEFWTVLSFLLTGPYIKVAGQRRKPMAEIFRIGDISCEDQNISSKSRTAPALSGHTFQSVALNFSISPRYRCR